MFWLVEGACAQQTISGTAPAATPSLSPAAEETPAFDADAKDDPTESVDWQDRVKVARQRHDDWLACVAARGRYCSQDQDSVPDPMDALLNDDTLVNGDIVSTPKGLKVFRGQSNVPHSLADFE
ncbi:MAG: hypothetical protein WAU78_03230 [Roseiarcus sp.]|jgi:hypothetical protein